MAKYNLAESLAVKARTCEVGNVGVSPNGSVDAWYEAAIEFKNFLDMVDYDKVNKFKKF